MLFTHVLPTPIGDVTLPAPVAVAILLAALIVAAGICTAHHLRKQAKARGHRRRAAAVPAERLTLTTPAGGTPAVAALPKRIPGRWVDPATGDPALAAAIGRHSSQHAVDIPAQRTTEPRQFPIPDDQPAPLDDMVNTPRVADPDLVPHVDRGVLSWLPADRPAGDLFTETDPEATTVLPLVRFANYRSGSWDVEHATTGGAR